MSGRGEEHDGDAAPAEGGAALKRKASAEDAVERADKKKLAALAVEEGPGSRRGRLEGRASPKGAGAASPKGAGSPNGAGAASSNGAASPKGAASPNGAGPASPKGAASPNGSASSGPASVADAGKPTSPKGGASVSAAAAPKTVFSAFTSSVSPLASLASESVAGGAAAGGGFASFGKSPFASFAAPSVGSGFGAPIAGSGFGGFAASTFGASFGSADTGAASAFGSSLLAGGGGGVFGSKKKAEEDEGEGGEEGNGEDEGQSALVFGGGGAGAAEEPPPEDIPTGEEGEVCTFKIRAKLYKLCPMEPEAPSPSESAAERAAVKPPAPAAAPAAAADKKEFKELGSGLVRVNVPEEGQEHKKPRIIMRREGTLKLLLNANIWDKLPIEKASDKVLRFTCHSVLVATEAAMGAPDTFLLRLPRADQCDELLGAIEKVRASANAG
jgi:hypothetical protein